MKEEKTKTKFLIQNIFRPQNQPVCMSLIWQYFSIFVKKSVVL